MFGKAGCFFEPIIVKVIPNPTWYKLTWAHVHCTTLQKIKSDGSILVDGVPQYTNLSFMPTYTHIGVLSSATYYSFAFFKFISVYNILK